ncbi:hypothetical protein F5B20DRAFT_573230 [Whalleya microplaca]|nr:hypothetical protein F5B20DRAFT_573230 [Whalleya microplaca]
MGSEDHASQLTSPEAYHKKEYHIRDLGTRSVTLFPSRAQVIRDIKDVPLKPGTNQIVILGLTPTLDEHSVKIEGTGSAIISDTVVELLPNRETFQDVYPDSDSDETDAPPVREEKGNDTNENSDLRIVTDKIRALDDEQERVTELIQNAEARLKFVDLYGETLAEHPIHNGEINIEKAMAAYKAERQKAFEDYMTEKIKSRELREQSAALKKEQQRLTAPAFKEVNNAHKAEAKITRATKKEKDKQKREKDEQANEKLRVRKERESFWPKQVYIIKVSLEVGTFTPTSSRRNSISSYIDVTKAAPEEAVEAVPGDDTTTATCNLTLSYVTTHAHWSPSYDLVLSTTTNSGMLCFDARLTNKTSETWNNCKIILSTSQTDLSNLDDAIPSLVPWHIRLSELIGEDGPDGHAGIVYSREEWAHKALSQQAVRNTYPPREQMFGVGHESRAARFSPFSMSNNITEKLDSHVSRNRYSSGPSKRSFGRQDAFTDNSRPPENRLWNDDGISGLMPELEFQESAFEENGLTATYDLPGLKCLPPSSTVSKQRVAHVTFRNIIFSHTVVAKHKPAAYLQAKLRNGSKLTLLKGPTSLTLDGSFLGRAAVPRCLPGDAFKLSLGVDPAIQVSYPMPKVHRSQTGLGGIFIKENSGVVTRTMALSNTRRGAKSKPIRLTALEQVPVSEDDRLRVVMRQPKGLVADGTRVSTGKSAIDSLDDNSWGKAEAAMEEGGKVVWDVTVNPGHTAKLTLEYECVYPMGDSVVCV